MVYYRLPVEIVRAHFVLEVLTSKSLEPFFKILNRTVLDEFRTKHFRVLGDRNGCREI